ncbi:hypothetical protein HNQ56_004182 [Anaerotaenia torta]|uniref:L,D-transpeptidase family protein n=1 Tax=Anaerotaenia torta TaxID=433293 RepID=UPI003D1CB965
MKIKRMIRTFGMRSVALLLTATLVLAGGQKASAAEVNKSPYLIKVNRYHNTITVYEQDEKGEYTVPIKAMACSVGTGNKTRLGTFPLREKYRWKALMGDVWGQYASRIVGGILFHSVYYYKNGNPATLATAQYNKLGKAASHGCIRLTVADAKWIYDNCPTGTNVVIYDDKKSPGPLGKPNTIRIASSVRWDPTDPDERNPYSKELPELLASEAQLLGVKDRTAAWGEEIDLYQGVTAVSSSGKDITETIQVKGTVNPYIAGTYQVTYSIKDDKGKEKKQTAVITVKECTEDPYIIDIKERVVAESSQINKEYALDGIRLYYKGDRLDENLLTVNIECKDTREYIITYELQIAEDRVISESVEVLVDREEPSFTGVEDRSIAPGTELTREEAIRDVTVTDNYSQLEKSDIQVEMEKMEEGYYLVTYMATDSAGNIGSIQAKYYYN